MTSDELRGQRTLATVLFTDCVGFSARMSADEDRTLDLIRRDLKYMRKVCAKFEGHVLKSTGDGLLMYFLSAVKAVECAVEIQATLASAQHPSAEDYLQHRIGIHLADLFITETDVMGNGVNIAARIQAEAEPGGISISQTVYDVIKPNLHLEMVAMGVRSLKNIREAIAIYNIVLSPQDAAARQFTEVIRTLERDSNLPRIKKLLHYACRNIWEGDSSALQALNLHELLREALTRAPSPAKLEYFLSKTANSLSKPLEYTPIVHLLVLEVGKLCPHQPRPCANPSEALTAPLFAAIQNQDSAMPSDHPTLYRQIAQALAASDQAQRLHKLLFYACQNRWESDPTKLQACSLENLVRDMHQQAPTLQQLQAILSRFVQTISKPEEYQAIATAIATTFTPLYPITAPRAPQAAPDAAHPFPPAAVGMSCTLPSDSPNDSPSIPAPIPAPIPVPIPTAAPTAVPATPSSKLDLFNFRLELMKYTNPLQSKILLYSALYETFQFTPQDWSDLKQHTLHSLMGTLFQTCATYTDLEFLLYRTARRLPNAEEAVQTATEVIKCLRSFYIYGGPVAIAQQASTSASGAIRVTATPTDPTALLSHSDEATCQLRRPTEKPAEKPLTTFQTKFS